MQGARGDAASPGDEAAADDRGFAAALSEAIRDSGLSLERLSDRLVRAGTPLTAATLSYWQTGRSRPTRAASLRALTGLEGALSLPPGYLTALASQPAPGAARHWDLVHHRTDIDAAYAAEKALGTGRSLSRVSIHHTLHVAADRTESLLHVRQIWCADVDGIESFPVIQYFDAMDIEPTLHAVSACEVERVTVLHESAVLAAEMRFTHPLRRDELVATELVITRSSAVHEASVYLFGAVAPLEQLVLEARFTPGTRPERIWRIERERFASDGPGHEPGDVLVPDAQGVWLDAAPRVYGLQWEWE